MNDFVSTYLHDYNNTGIYAESVLERMDPREIQSMPDLSMTTLNDQIEYDLDDYKINESSRINTTNSEVENRKYIPITLRNPGFI